MNHRAIPLLVLMAGMVISCDRSSGGESEESALEPGTLQTKSGLKITRKERPLRTAKMEDRNKKMILSDGGTGDAALVITSGGNILVDVLQEDRVKRRRITPKKVVGRLHGYKKIGGSPFLLTADEEASAETQEAFRFKGFCRPSLSQKELRLRVDFVGVDGGDFHVTFTVPEDYARF